MNNGVNRRIPRAGMRKLEVVWEPTSEPDADELQKAFEMLFRADFTHESSASPHDAFDKDYRSAIVNQGNGCI